MALYKNLNIASVNHGFGWIFGADSSTDTINNVLEKADREVGNLVKGIEDLKDHVTHLCKEIARRKDIINELKEENFKLKLLGWVDMKPCKLQDHVFYERKDFTENEIRGNNHLAVAVLIQNRKICKICGSEVLKVEDTEALNEKTI